MHSASIQDRDGAKDVLIKAKHQYPAIVKFFADGGYAGALQNWCFLEPVLKVYGAANFLSIREIILI